MMKFGTKWIKVSKDSTERSSEILDAMEVMLRLLDSENPEERKAAKAYFARSIKDLKAINAKTKDS